MATVDRSAAERGARLGPARRRADPRPRPARRGLPGRARLRARPQRRSLRHRQGPGRDLRHRRPRGLAACGSPRPATTSATVQDQIDADLATITGFLSEQGIEAEAIQPQRVEVTDLLAQPYRPEGVGENRFILAQTVIVRTEQVDLVARLNQQTGELVKRGVVLVDSGGPDLPVHAAQRHQAGAARRGDPQRAGGGRAVRRRFRQRDRRDPARLARAVRDPGARSRAQPVRAQPAGQEDPRGQHDRVPARPLRWPPAGCGCSLERSRRVRVSESRAGRSVLGCDKRAADRQSTQPQWRGRPVARARGSDQARHRGHRAPVRPRGRNRRNHPTRARQRRSGDPRRRRRHHERRCRRARRVRPAVRHPADRHRATISRARFRSRPTSSSRRRGHRRRPAARDRSRPGQRQAFLQRRQHRLWRPRSPAITPPSASGAFGSSPTS